MKNLHIYNTHKSESTSMPRWFNEVQYNGKTLPEPERKELIFVIDVSIR